MAILQMDGFDHYLASAGSISALVAGLWTPGGVNQTVDTIVMPILGGYGASIGNRTTLTFNLPSTYTTGTIGLATHFYSSSPSALNFRFGTSGSATYCTVNISGGTLSIHGTSGTVTSDTTLDTSVLYHIEIKVSLGTSSTGSIEVRLNGATIATQTGQTITGLTTVAFENTSYPQSYNQYIDNVVIWDGSGTINNDWLGERNVVTLLPSADTTTADWSLSSGTDGFDLINDIPADEGNYISSNTVGDESQFDLDSLTDTGVTISAIQVIASTEKDASGEGAIQVGVITSGGTADYGDDFTLTQDQYLYTAHVSEINPDTSVQWTPEDIASVKIGVKRT